MNNNKFYLDISPELGVLIRQMMSPDPDSRPTVDHLLSHKKLVCLMERRDRWKLLIKMVNIEHIKSLCSRK